MPEDKGTALVRLIAAGRVHKIREGQFVKVNDDGTYSVHDSPRTREALIAEIESRGDESLGDGSLDKQEFLAMMRQDNRVAQMPAVVEVKAMLDALAVEGRVDSHAHSELMSLLDDIPDCESATATPHDEHGAIPISQEKIENWKHHFVSGFVDQSFDSEQEVYAQGSFAEAWSAGEREWEEVRAALLGQRAAEVDVMSIPVHLRRCPEHGMPDCSPLLNGCNWPSQLNSIVEHVSREAAAVAAGRGGKRSRV